MYDTYYEEQKQPSRWLQMMTSNPRMAGGICIFVLWSAVVFVNAGFLQSNQHPAPIASTRAQSSVTIAQQTQNTARNNAQTGFEVASSDPLIEEVQAALAAKNFYTDKLDGQIGERTRQAIIAYQKAANLPIDGIASGNLLAHIRMSHVVNHTIAQASSQTEGQTTGSVATPKFLASSNLAVSAEQLKQIQTGLRNYAHPEMAIDGLFGSQTRAAIENFEKDHQLLVTGQPSETLLNKLIEIGAL